MLAIRQSSTAEARWAARSWPALVAATSRPDLQAQLYWALVAMRDAADAEDLDAVENLSTEAQLCLECLSGSQSLDARAHTVTLGVWSELCRAIGALSWTRVAYCADLLRRVLPAPPQRTAHSVPEYVPPDRRLDGGALPRVTRLSDIPDRCPQTDRLLLLIAVATATGGGHLVDFHTAGQPPLTPSRAGWINGNPAAALLGSYRSSADRGEQALLLRPRATVAAINAMSPTGLTAASAGRLLLARWIVEGTLVVTGTKIRRTATQRVPLTDAAGVDEELWIVPAAVYARDQFGAGHGSGRPRRHLRSAPQPPEPGQA